MKTTIPNPTLLAFDYGETLAHETMVNHRLGNKAVLSAATENPLEITVEQLSNAAIALDKQFLEMRNRFDFEVPLLTFNRILHQKCRLKFAVSEQELEYIFWSHAFAAEPVPFATEVLRFCNARSIPTAVVSNIMLSGSCLKRFLVDIFPDCCPDLVLTSADYGLKKPLPTMFDVLKSKTEGAPDTVWFVGDKPHRDAQGALNAGLTAFQLRTHRNLPFAEGCTGLRDLSDLLVLLKEYFPD